MLNGQEKKIIYLSVTAGVAFLLISFLIIIPSYQKIKEINQQIFSLRSQLEIKYEEAQRVHKSQIKFGEAKKLSDQLNNRFLKKGEELSLITSLETLADKYGLKQNLSLNPQLLKDQFNYPYLELSISLTGQLPGLMNYVENLEKSNHYNYINEINITRGSAPALGNQRNISNPLTLNFKAQIYVQQ